MRVPLSKVVVVKYRGPTASRGARWLCKTLGEKSKSYPRDYNLDARDDALRVAYHYMQRFARGRERFVIDGWGYLPDNEIVVFGHYG